MTQKIQLIYNFYIFYLLLELDFIFLIKQIVIFELKTLFRLSGLQPSIYKMLPTIVTFDRKKHLFNNKPQMTQEDY